MPVKDLVGLYESTAAAERRSSLPPARRTAQEPVQLSAGSGLRRSSLPAPPALRHPSVATRAVSNSDLPHATPARFIRHPLLQTPVTAKDGPATARVRMDSTDTQTSAIAPGNYGVQSSKSTSPSTPTIPLVSPFRDPATQSSNSSQPSVSAQVTRPSLVEVAQRANPSRRASALVSDIMPSQTPPPSYGNPFAEPSTSLSRPPSFSAKRSSSDMPLLPLSRIPEPDALVSPPTRKQVHMHRAFGPHSPVPAKQVFARKAAPLYLPALDKLLSGFSEPAFETYPLPTSGKGKMPSTTDLFPPMNLLTASGSTIDDLEHNAPVPPAWADRNTIFGGLVSAVLGILGSSAIAKHYSLTGLYDTVQLFALVLSSAVPPETVLSGWRKTFLSTIPNALALNFPSDLVQSLAFLAAFLLLACILLRSFARSTASLASTVSREGLKPTGTTSGWKVVLVSFILTVLYLPLSTIALHALVWSSDFWVVANPYLNGTAPATLPALGPPDLYRDPYDFCYTTTMLKDQINFAPAVVLLSAFTFCLMAIWFPIRLSKAIRIAMPDVDPYTELGKVRTADELEMEYQRLIDRDHSPYAFLYNDFRRTWATYKSIYLWAKLSTLLIVAVLDPDNCVFRNADRNTINVVRQSVLVVAMLLFFLIQCFLAPFIDPVSNANEWVSRLNYLSTSAVGLLVAFNVPGSAILNGPVLYVIYAITYGLSGYFSVINFGVVRKIVKKLARRIDFSIDIFSPHLDVSSSSPHIRRRIWQESVSVLLLVTPECKIPANQTMEFILVREHDWPPYLANFQGTPGERHVENLKILREVGWPAFRGGLELHDGPHAHLFRKLEDTILKHYIGPDSFWRDPAKPPVPGEMSYFGNAWWIPFPPTLVMRYDDGHYTALTTLAQFVEYVKQNGSQAMERKRQLRMALRALDGQIVHWPYTHSEMIGSRSSWFRGQRYTAQTAVHFERAVIQIIRQGDLSWNGVQLGSGFEVQLTYTTDVRVDGTVIGLDEDFDLTPTLAKFLQLNSLPVHGKVDLINSALHGYRRYFRKEMARKENTLTHRFLSTVYNTPQGEAELVKTALATERDSRVRDTFINHGSAFAAAFERLSTVSQSQIHTFWFTFWDDLWRRNFDTISQFTTFAPDFNPWHPSSIAYRPLPRPALEAFLSQRGLYGASRQFFHSGFLNKLYFRLNSLAFHGSKDDILMHLGLTSSELSYGEVDLKIHQRGATGGTGGGTDHDDASIRPRPAFTWEQIWADPVTHGKWRESSWRGKLGVWFGLTPLWTTSTTAGIALDVTLRDGRYVLLTDDD